MRIAAVGSIVIAMMALAVTGAVSQD